MGTDGIVFNQGEYHPEEYLCQRMIKTRSHSMILDHRRGISMPIIVAQTVKLRPAARRSHQWY